MFLDIKLGIVWAVLIGLVFGEPLTPIWFAAGILFALLPDLDFWIEYLKRGTVGGKVMGAHRLLLHNPIVFLPMGLLIGYFLGFSWALLFAFGIVGHLVHDSMGMGFGVRWLWPLSENFYKIFSDRKGNIYYDRVHLAFTAWTPEEAAAVTREKGNDNWLREDISYHKKRLSQHLLKFAVLGLTALAAYFLLNA